MSSTRWVVIYYPPWSSNDIVKSRAHYKYIVGSNQELIVVNIWMQERIYSMSNYPHLHVFYKIYVSKIVLCTILPVLYFSIKVNWLYVVCTRSFVQFDVKLYSLKILLMFLLKTMSISNSVYLTKSLSYLFCMLAIKQIGQYRHDNQIISSIAVPWYNNFEIRLRS